MSNEKNLAMRFALEAALKQTKKPRGFKEGHKAGVKARGMTACMIYADDAPYQKFIGVDPGIGEDGKPLVDGVVIGHKFSTDFGDRGIIVDRKDLLFQTQRLADTEYFNRRQALIEAGMMDEEGNLKAAGCERLPALEAMTPERLAELADEIDPGMFEKPIPVGFAPLQEILSADGTKGVRVTVLKAPPELSEQIRGTVEALVTEEAIAKRYGRDSEGGLDETYALPGDSPAYALDQILKAELGDGTIKFEPKIQQAVLIDPFQTAVDVDLQINDLDSVTAEPRSASRAIMLTKARKVTPGVSIMQDKHSVYQEKNDAFYAELEKLALTTPLFISPAQELLFATKTSLIGKTIYTMSTDDFLGGLVTITQYAPDDNCQEIIFEVTNEAGQTMGVFFDEVIGVPV